MNEIEARRALAAAPLADAFLPSLYRATAPYRGCGHGCRYCDGRAERYYVDGDFERDVAARRNLPALLRAEIGRGVARREWGAVCLGSGVTDVYQPAEETERLTRALLAELAETGLPFVVLTKNALVRRDFDLISRFPRALVMLTLTTLDPDLARLLEPGASPPADRLACVRAARDAGFRAGVMAMPLCPGITDGAESFHALAEAALDAGAEFVYPGGLTLRPGRQKDCFVSLVRESFPNLAPLYAKVYGEERPSGMPRMDYAAPRDRDWGSWLDARGTPRLVPHSIYRDFLSAPDSLFVLLCHMATLYAARGIDTRPLSAALTRYADWLKGERAALRRSRVKTAPSDPFPLTRVLAERLADAASSTGPRSLESILGNERLARFARSVVAEGAVFDYASLGFVIQ